MSNETKTTTTTSPVQGADSVRKSLASIREAFAEFVERAEAGHVGAITWGYTYEPPGIESGQHHVRAHVIGSGPGVLGITESLVDEGPGLPALIALKMFGRPSR